MRNVKRHIQAQHLGRRFACPGCTYVATQKVNLVAHMKAKHTDIQAEGVEESSSRGVAGEKLNQMRGGLELADQGGLEDDCRDECEEDLPLFEHNPFKHKPVSS